jgi:hypothetical protein
MERPSALIDRALERACQASAAGYAGEARAAPRGRRLRAVGDPQAPLGAFLAILEGHGLLGDDGWLMPDVHLVSMGDHFDWGVPAEREDVARSGLGLLGWLAAHPPEQVTLILGNHDLGRVGELAGFDDDSFRAAQAEADAVASGSADERGFRERYPQLPTAEVASRDLATYRHAQARLVGDLLRARRFCAALAPSPRLLLTHAGVTKQDLGLARVPAGDASDAGAVASALNAALDGAMASWREGTPLAIADLHRPGSASQGEGRGIFYHRPGRPKLPDNPAELFAGPPRRRFDPRDLPPGLTQAVGHIGDRKCRHLLGEPWGPPASGATVGRLRHLRANHDEVAYAVGVGEAPDPREALMLFLDGTMARADTRAYELLDLDTLRPAPPALV